MRIDGAAEVGYGMAKAHHEVHGREFGVRPRLRRRRGRYIGGIMKPRDWQGRGGWFGCHAVKQGRRGETGNSGGHRKPVRGLQQSEFERVRRHDMNFPMRSV